MYRRSQVSNRLSIIYMDSSVQLQLSCLSKLSQIYDRLIISGNSNLIDSTKVAIIIILLKTTASL